MVAVFCDTPKPTVVMVGLVPTNHRAAGSMPEFCFCVTTKITSHNRGAMGPRDKAEDDTASE